MSTMLAPLRAAAAAAALAALLVVAPYGASRLENGCSMTRMRPQYAPADVGVADGRYALVRYREFGRRRGDGDEDVAVLFLPGNGGDFKQARSLGHELAFLEGSRSFATYAANFKEELSAHDGRLVLRQAAFAARCVAALNAKHAGGVVVVGHSMGGVAGVLAARNASTVAVLALAAPLAGHPFAADRTLAGVYDDLRDGADDVTVVASISGGPRDWQIPPWLGAPRSGLHVVAPKIPGCGRVVSVDHQCACWCNELVAAVAAAVNGAAALAAEAPAVRAAALEQRLGRPQRDRGAPRGGVIAAALPFFAEQSDSWARASLAAAFAAPRVPLLLLSRALLPGGDAVAAAAAAAAGAAADLAAGGGWASAGLAAALHGSLAALVAAPLARPFGSPRPVAPAVGWACAGLAALHPALGLAAAAAAGRRSDLFWAAASLGPALVAAAQAGRALSPEPLAGLVLVLRLVLGRDGGGRAPAAAAALAAWGAATARPHRALEALALHAALSRAPTKRD